MLFNKNKTWQKMATKSPQEVVFIVDYESDSENY